MGPWVRREKQRGRRVRLQGSANFQKSLAYYNKAIQLKPKLAEAYMYRGVLYAQMGRKADAQADLVLLKKMNGHLAKELEQSCRPARRTTSCTVQPRRSEVAGIWPHEA